MSGKLQIFPRVNIKDQGQRRDLDFDWDWDWDDDDDFDWEDDWWWVVLIIVVVIAVIAFGVCIWKHCKKKKALRASYDQTDHSRNIHDINTRSERVPQEVALPPLPQFSKSVPEHENWRPSAPQVYPSIPTIIIDEPPSYEDSVSH